MEMFECGCKYRELADVTILTTFGLDIFKELQLHVKSGNRYEDKEIAVTIEFILEKGGFYLRTDITNQKVIMILDTDEKIDVAINKALTLFKPKKYKLSVCTIDDKPSFADCTLEIYQFKDDKYVKSKEIRKKKETEE